MAMKMLHSLVGGYQYLGGTLVTPSTKTTQHHSPEDNNQQI